MKSAIFNYLHRSTRVFSCAILFLASCNFAFGQDFLALSEQIKYLSPKSTIIKFSEDDTDPYFAVKIATQTKSSKGVALIFHGHGEHPDSPGVIHTLRTHLPKYGWDTLSLQFPDSDEELNIYKKQLAIFLASQQLKDIVLINRGANTQDALNSLPSDFATPLAIVTISLSAKTGDDRDIVNLITKFNSPFLDIYGQRDYTYVKSAGRQRASIMNDLANNTETEPQAKYQQMIVPIANHAFRGQEHTLAKRIAGWLKKNTSKRTIRIETTEVVQKKSED